MRKVITGRFVGLDGSLGYRLGRYYGLVVEYDIPMWRRILKRWPADWQVVVTAPIFCPYYSWETLLKNWDIDGGMGDERL